MKAKNIRFYYGIFLSVFTGAVGISFVVQALRILAAGEWAQGAFTREIVGKMLFPVSIPFLIWIAAIIAGFILSVIFPYTSRKTVKVSERLTRNRLLKRLPEGSGAEYEANLKRVHGEKKSRTIVFFACLAVCLACGIAAAVYLLNRSHFNGIKTNDAMFKMFINVAPWLVVAFGCCIGATLFEKYSLNREINALKALIADYKGNTVVAANVTENAVVAKIKSVLSSKYTVWGVRGAVAVFGVTFVILGIFNEGVRDVLIKAINICTECIGLG